jgi:hypothetical protein
MGRPLGRVDHERRGPSAAPQPQDAWMPVNERHELERINERFLALLKQEKEASEKDVS